MTAGPDDDIDWSLTTWRGSRLQQHREFHALPFARKLEVLEEMSAQARGALSNLQNRGLPYIDPFTGKAIRPPTDAAVNEPEV